MPTPEYPKLAWDVAWPPAQAPAPAPLLSDGVGGANVRIIFAQEPQAGQNVSAQIHEVTTKQQQDAAMADPTREEIDLRHQLAEAKTDNKFGQLDTKLAQLIGQIEKNGIELRADFEKSNNQLSGDIRVMSTRLDSVEKHVYGMKPIIITTGIGAVALLAAVIIGFLAFGQAWYATGIAAREAIQPGIKDEISRQLTPPAQATAPAAPQQQRR